VEDYTGEKGLTPKDIALYMLRKLDVHASEVSDLVMEELEVQGLQRRYFAFQDAMVAAHFCDEEGSGKAKRPNPSPEGWEDFGLNEWEAAGAVKL
jgi:hypothetical protein